MRGNYGNIKGKFYRDTSSLFRALRSSPPPFKYIDEHVKFVYTNPPFTFEHTELKDNVEI